MGTLWQDIRYGLRMLQKSPGFTLVAVLTLALGIGANTALFSVVNGVLLNPLPFPHPEQLVRIHESKVNFATGSISFPNFRDWRDNNRTFSAMAVTRGMGMSLTGLGEAERVRVQMVTSDFFQILGVNAAIGRLFAPGEDEIGRAPIALVSAGFWKRKLGGTPDALGKVLTLDGGSFTVVGVIPASFDFAVGAFRPADVYLPVGQWGNPLLTARTAGLGFHGLGRLKPGVTLEQAQADMDAVTAQLEKIYPDVNKGVGARIRTLRQEMLGRIQPFLLVLLAAVGFVLLIACVNVANLMLARSDARMREFAVRAALGASRGRVVRQLLAESLLLAIAGGAAGLLLANWGTQAALQFVPESLPRANQVALDGRVLLFTVLLTLLSGVFFGLYPALRLSKPDVQESLKEGGRGASGARHRTHGAFVVAEVAMALVLLCGAGLMIRTLQQLWSIDPGFEPHNVMTFGAALSPSMMSNQTAEASRAALREFDARLGAVPGVKAISLSWGAVPLAGDDERLFWMEGARPASPNDMNWALSYVVEPDYLNLMQIPLLRGRFFTAKDDERGAPVAVVDDTLARKYFAQEDPVGKHIFLDGDPGAPPVMAEVIGVVGHVKQWGLDSDSRELQAQLYTPFMQLSGQNMAGSPSGISVLVRGEILPPALFDALRQTSRRMSGEQVLYGMQTMEEIISDSFATRRFTMALLGVFALVALALASLGIYGVISYLVGQRTREFAVRLALGAQPGHVMRNVLGQGARMALLGVGLGLLAAIGLTRLLARYSLLFGVSATDPVTFAAVAILLTIVALAACYVPARRAMRVDPLIALRYE
ncbi:MAG TPA: ABC transporter permease [Candidatus Acidoferrales bacterium]|nr:ABC transporter permease [Candidatus Acidoferrales bacterium]